MFFFSSSYPFVSTDFPFSIDKHTGELFARGFIDRETKENYNFEVTVSIALTHSPRSRRYTLVIPFLRILFSSLTTFQATDLGEPVQNTSCEVHIKIKDVNDVRPRFYTDPYLAHVPENLDPGHKVRFKSPLPEVLIPLSLRPSQVTQIAAFDPDLGENGQVFYRLGEGHDNKFYIDGKGLDRYLFF